MTGQTKSTTNDIKWHLHLLQKGIACLYSDCNGKCGVAHLAGLRIISCKSLLGCIALWADIRAADFLKGCLVGVNVATVNADVCGKLLLLCCQLAAKPGRCGSLIESFYIYIALATNLHCQTQLFESEYQLIKCRHQPKEATSRLQGQLALLRWSTLLLLMCTPARDIHIDHETTSRQPALSARYSTQQ